MAWYDADHRFVLFDERYNVIGFAANEASADHKAARYAQANQCKVHVHQNSYTMEYSPALYVRRAAQLEVVR